MGFDIFERIQPDLSIKSRPNVISNPWNVPGLASGGVSKA
jgi:hypothetical protein